MGRPNSRAELCAWVLGLMGAFFLLFGGAVLLWDIPVGGAGPDWAFLPIGAALLAAGGGCALACLARRRSQARLRREGTAVSGTVRSVRHHIFVTWNTQSFVNVPAGTRPGARCAGTPGAAGTIPCPPACCGGSPRRGRRSSFGWDPGPAGAGLCGPGFCPAGPYGIRGGGGPAPSRDLYSEF